MNPGQYSRTGYFEDMTISQARIPSKWSSRTVLLRHNTQRTPNTLRMALTHNSSEHLELLLCCCRSTIQSLASIWKLSARQLKWQFLLLCFPVPKSPLPPGEATSPSAETVKLKPGRYRFRCGTRCKNLVTRRNYIVFGWSRKNIQSTFFLQQPDVSTVRCAKVHKIHALCAVAVHLVAATRGPWIAALAVLYVQICGGNRYIESSDRDRLLRRATARSSPVRSGLYSIQMCSDKNRSIPEQLQQQQQRQEELKCMFI